MASEYKTLADLVKVNDQNLADTNLSDVFNRAELMGALAAVESSNATDHKYLVEESAPVVGFRAPNTGLENKKSTDRLVTINLKIIDAGFHVDRALADAYKDGPEMYIEREAGRHLRAALFGAEQQIINGTNANGFAGLADALDELEDEMVINAGGTTANTASSVYLIHTSETEGCAAVAKGELEIKDSIETTWTDGSGNELDSYRTPVYAWLGLQIGSKYDVARIANLTADSGKGLTDDMLFDAAERFPVGKRPNLVAMNRRSLNQLRKSRVATNATGAPVPTPTEVPGIGRIVVTDAIGSAESLIAAA
jgi:hypothetical protein